MADQTLTVADDPLALIPDDIRSRHYEVKLPTGETVCYSDRHRWPCHAHRLMKALDVLLKPHRRSLFPAWGAGSGDCHGKHYCVGCSIDGVKREWPCQPYQDAARELLGETDRG